VCVDLTSDENNCGTCGNVCVAQSCVDRTCETTVTPVPGFPTTVQVLGLWGTGPSNMWAVGGVGQNNPAIVHFDGTSWTSVLTGIAQGCALSGIWGTGASDIYAVSSCGGVVTHFDGSSWTQENQNVAPTFGLTAVWESSPTDVYVIGMGGLVM